MPAKPQLTQQEIDKLEIDPNIDFRKIAATPFAELTPNLIAMFKWSGVYHQLQKGYFMLRLRIPGGLLSSTQLRRAGNLTAELGQDNLCITTRQCLQFHWLRQQDIYKVIEGMAEVGILTTNACGDVCRNVIGCWGQGVCPHEIGDTREALLRIADDPELLQQKRNLPRKHKISVSGCDRSCSQTLMNCQGFVPVLRRREDDSSERGWKFFAGGGLGQRPYLAKPIFAWVPDDLIVDVARAAVEAHNRFGNRRQRKHARLKVVVDHFGREGFARQMIALLQERNLRSLERIEFADSDSCAIGHNPFEGETVIGEKGGETVTVRVIIPRSEFSNAQAQTIAALADDFGDGTIMFTQRQNLELRGVLAPRSEELLAALQAAGFRTEGFEHLPDMVSCVGTTMCNLAVSDTPETYRRLSEIFATHDDLSRQVGPLRINLNGCPNGCGQHWVHDIGLRGRRLLRDNGSEEGFTIFVGGRLDGDGRIGEAVGDVTSSDLGRAVVAILQLYLAERRQGERFADWTERFGSTAIAAKLGLPLTPEHPPVNQRNLALAEVFRAAVAETLEG